MSDLIPARIPRHLLVDALFGSSRRRTEATDEILEIIADAASGFPLDDVDEVCEACVERIEGKNEPTITITAIHYDSGDPECPFCTASKDDEEKEEEAMMCDDEDCYCDDWCEECDDYDYDFYRDEPTGYSRFQSGSTQEERNTAVDALLS